MNEEARTLKENLEVTKRNFDDTRQEMETDWRGPVHVSAETEDRWRRECKRYGLVQYTKNFEEKIRKVGRFAKW